MAGSGSLGSNPPIASIDITTHATDWLWAVFAIMLVSDLIVIAWAFRRPIGTRVFHQLPIAILTTASIAYFAMASDLGAAAIPVEFARGRAPGITRSIWYVRYIDWTITTPLLLLEILIGTGLALSDIFTVVFLDLVMIVAGLVGALVASSYKWGFFVFGCLALLYIWWILVVHAPASALVLGQDVRSAYIGSAIYLALIWALYPVAWGLADGGNIISPTAEMIFYGILDVLAKPVFIFFHLWALRNIDYHRFGLSSGKATQYAAGGVGPGGVGTGGLGRGGVEKGAVGGTTTTAGTNAPVI